MELDQHKRLVFFDGTCNFCSFWVKFIVRRDPKGKFLFAPLDSPQAQARMKEMAIPGPLPDSVVLWERERLHFKSGAVLRIFKQLRFPWPILYVLVLVPPFLRNSVYDFIARRRYRWFGKHDSCMVPTAELKSRFL